MEEIRRPTGNGSINELSRFGAVANYLCVLEAVSDDDSTYVYIGDDGNYEDDYTVASTSIPIGSTINSVSVYAKIKTGTVEYGTNEVGLVIGGNGYFSGNLIGSNEGYTEVHYTWLNNPSNSNDWTVASIDTFNISLFLSFSRCTQVYVLIDYTEATTTSTTSTSISTTSISTTSTSTTSTSISTTSTSSSTTSTSTTSTSTTSSSSSNSSSSSSSSSISTTSTSSSSSTSTTTIFYDKPKINVKKIKPDKIKVWWV